MRSFKFTAFALALLALAACGKSAGKDEAKKQTGSPITVTQAEVASMPVVEEVVGWIESKNAPVVSAETPGRVSKVYVDAGTRVTAGQLLATLDPTDNEIAAQAARAEAMRVDALLGNQRRLVERYQGLAAENFISKVTLDNAESQLMALEEQAKAANAQRSAAERKLDKTRIVAPITGQVDQRFVSEGSYIDMGKPVFQLSSGSKIRAYLPFPETVADQVKPGLKVALSTPSDSSGEYEGAISDVRPMVGASNRAVVAAVEMDNPGVWKPGASVTGRVTLHVIENAVIVPEQSVVKRPAGEVVYVVEKEQASQRVVKTGYRATGAAQILEGLAGGETVALDGASYLTDKAQVTVKNPKTVGQAPAAGVK
ncbi:MAG: efflux RND transporter periplasmic adaptor subunit [Nitrospinae bacterium]|nr:efflux RND transporter periplasmic adaptor subunit [Nitrospinota bacterium]